MPEVSVIIPNYNHAPYLKERIDSVLNQTYQDFELIILDDLSSDNSREIIELYRGHPKVSHIVFNETNSGSTFKQWKKGFSIAQGNYIWIAESDDWCEPTLLKHLAGGLKQNNNCVIAYCQSYCVRDKDILWNSTHHVLDEYLNGKSFIQSKMVEGNAIFNASMCLFRKNAAADISQDYMNFKFCGDWAFWIEIAKKGDVFINGRVLNYFRKHGKDISGQAYKDGINFPEELSILSNLYQEKIIDEETFLITLKEKYYRYKIVEQTLPPVNRELIKQLFFQDKKTEVFLTGRQETRIRKVLRRFLKA